ncbi:MAG: PcfJ domain-containing protein [Lachnospiraceae bacterium]|nr:PcfJ domain-containing protein [Lachnospiraceae bacterium]
MKKKAIEKIPYLTLPKVSRKKMVEYIGVTAFKIIAHECHLFVEVYRNDKACKNVPVVRIVLNKKDFGTFFPESGAWSRGRIKINTWDNYGLIWREDDERIWKSIDIIEEENILYSQEHLKRIKAFTNVELWRESSWWDYIDKKQKDITATEYREKERRKYERRQQALEERKKQTPELPESRILEYADQVIFHELHYLYYKKHGVRAAVACSKCGGVSDERWKPGISYESQFEKLIQEPRMGEFGTCPMCGARGKYMPQGRVKGFYRQTTHLFLGQRYKENGMVFRYIEVGKEWQLELICGEKEPEMYNSREKLDGIEIARAYFEPGKKVQKDYQKHNPWSGEDFWDDCNLSGLANINVREARILPETYRNMEGTFIQYSAMEEYQRAAGDINPVDYIERYIQTPQIEMLVKLGLIGIVQQLVKCRYGIVADENADRVETFLGIRKKRVKQLIEKKGDTDILRVMQMEKRAGQKWTDEQIKQLAETGIDNTQIAQAMEHMTIQKLLNHISKYAGCEYGTMCSTAIGRLAATTQTYFDYLVMREALGYDMTNTVYLFPRDLSTAHAKMVQEYNKKEADLRLREVAVKYPLIKKNYRRFRKAFYYEDENYLIRPARNAEEIVMEGRILHHCVGGDNYLDKHNSSKSIILFLRTTREPEMPYITVEISMDTLNILQWYGAHDKKPDQRNMDRWLIAYETRLKCQRDGTLKEAAVDRADGAAMLLLAYA